VVHDPQWLASVRVSMHTPLHTFHPAGHEQLPPTHASPPPHTPAHDPQCEGSFVRFTHPALPQLVRPDGHVPPSPGAMNVSIGASVLPSPCVTPSVVASTPSPSPSSKTKSG
jgi:hypothetical protein